METARLQIVRLRVRPDASTSPPAPSPPSVFAKEHEARGAFRLFLWFWYEAKEVKETCSRLDNLKCLHNGSCSASKKCMFFVAWCLFVLCIRARYSAAAVSLSALHLSAGSQQDGDWFKVSEKDEEQIDSCSQ